MKPDFRTALMLYLTLNLLVLSSCVQQPYRKVIHNSDPKAKCLDGTSPALYIHEGAEKNKFFLFLQGGGQCDGFSTEQVLDSCYERSKTDLGSSKYLKDEEMLEGFLSTDPKKSKFANWTKVKMMYCDGAYHQGSNPNPVQYKDTSLYFRGADNIRSHLQYLLNNYNLASAESVVWTGSSAGALACFLWTNYVRSLLNRPEVMVSVPDSGAFLNYPSSQTGIKNYQIVASFLFKVANAGQKTPNEKCNRNQEKGKEYRCFFFEVLWEYIEGRVLMISSQYDSEIMPGIIDVYCMKDGTVAKTLKQCSSKQLAIIEEYRKTFLNVQKKFISLPDKSAWSIACAQHCFAEMADYYDNPQEKIPQSKGKTVKDALEEFVFNKNSKIQLVDQGPWPNNSACAN